MSDLALDEWVWSDLGGENLSESPASQIETFKFLKAIFKKCNRIVVVRRSAFAEKAMKFWKVAESDPRLLRIAKFYKASFFDNSEKVKLINEEELKPLPHNLSASLKIDDQYLVRAYLTADAKLIVTTDEPLKEVLDGNSVNCSIRGEFVPSYVSEYLES